jgi:hypothetical protein
VARSQRPTAPALRRLIVPEADGDRLAALHTFARKGCRALGDRRSRARSLCQYRCCQRADKRHATSGALVVMESRIGVPSALGVLVVLLTLGLAAQTACVVDQLAATGDGDRDRCRPANHEIQFRLSPISAASISRSRSRRFRGTARTSRRLPSTRG